MSEIIVIDFLEVKVNDAGFSRWCLYSLYSMKFLKQLLSLPCIHLQLAVVWIWMLLLYMLEWCIHCGRPFCWRWVTVSDLSRNYSETLFQLVTIHCKWTLTEVFLWEQMDLTGHSITAIVLAGQIQCADDSRGKERSVEDPSTCFSFFPLYFSVIGKSWGLFVLPCFSFLSVWPIKISNVIFTFLSSE